MSNILLICKKELKSYFASPIAYILMAFFGLIFGFGFYTATRDMIRYSFQAQMMGQQAQMNVNDQIIRPLLGFASTIALFLIPMITMRTFAEEKSRGTIELLMTSPVKDYEIIIGCSKDPVKYQDSGYRFMELANGKKLDCLADNALNGWPGGACRAAITRDA